MSKPFEKCVIFCQLSSKRPYTRVKIYMKSVALIKLSASLRKGSFFHTRTPISWKVSIWCHFWRCSTFSPLGVIVWKIFTFFPQSNLCKYIASIYTTSPKFSGLYSSQENFSEITQKLAHIYSELKSLSQKLSLPPKQLRSLTTFKTRGI